ncbi:MAG: efflux RND transporter periplasmic adaptor subunit [Aquisalimonadaceae bacterium]
MRVIYQLAGVAAIAVVGVTGWTWLNLQQTGGDSAGAARGGGAVPVEVVAARAGVVQETVSAVGTTLARESVDIVAEVAGRIAAIRFEEGQRVSSGDVLFELDQSREDAELREAIAQRDDARAKYQRARALREDDNVSQAQVEELAALLEANEARVAVARSRVVDRQIRAPFDGVTGLRDVSLGAYVAPGTRLTTLDDLAVVRVDFAVPERFLASLQPGLPVEARNVAYREQSFGGEVIRVGTRVDPVTRAVRVQSEFDNDHGELRPGMFMTVRLILGQRDNAVLVPEEALVTQGEFSFAFVVSEDRARRVELVVGQRRGGEVEILEGIDSGQKVVVAGLQRLRDGATVRVLDSSDSSAMAVR